MWLAGWLAAVRRHGPTAHRVWGGEWARFRLKGPCRNWGRRHVVGVADGADRRQVGGAIVA